MSSARLATELQVFEETAMGGIAEAGRVAMFAKWRMNAYENLFINRRGGLVWALLLSVFAPGKLRDLVEVEFKRIVAAKEAKMSAKAAQDKRDAQAHMAAAEILRPAVAMDRDTRASRSMRRTAGDDGIIGVIGANMQVVR